MTQMPPASLHLSPSRQPRAGAGCRGLLLGLVAVGVAVTRARSRATPAQQPVTLLGDRQTFTRRTGPLTWRDDPIVAATQTAYLPRLPHEAQEGWVRVTPGDAAGVDGAAAGTEGAP